jgi:DNA primase
MDCITLHQYGFQESVAISGTALSENLIQNIKTLTDQVYFLLDNDQAGQKAMSRLNAIMLKEGLNPKRVDLTPHKDPDEFLIKEGQLALNERIENAITVLDFTLEQLVGDKIPSSTDQKLKKLNEVFAQLKPLGDNLMASEKVIFWAKRLGLQSSPNEIAKAYQDFLQLSPNSNPLPVKDSSSEFTSTRSGNHLQNSEITESDDEIDQIENESPADLGPISVLSESAQAIAWESERSIWKTEKKLLQNLVQNPTLFECEELGEVLDFIEHSEVKQFIRTIQEYFFEIEESEFPKMVKGLLSNDQCSIEIKEIIGSGLFNYLPQKMDDKIRDKMFTDFKKGLHYDHLKEERNRLKVLQKQAISDEQSFEVLSQIGKIEREMNQLKK